MSAAGGVEMPRTEHSEAILEGHWPSASEAAWTTYAASLKAAARQLGSELAGNQADIKEMVAPMSGHYIDAVMHVIRSREDALWDRYNAYEAVAEQAQRGIGQLIGAKNLLLDIVMAAESKIAQERTAAAEREADASTRPLTAAAEIAAIRADLYETELNIVADAKAEAAATDARAAGEVTALLSRLVALTPSDQPTASGNASATPLSTGTGSTTAPAAPPGIQPVDYNTFGDDRTAGGTGNATNDRAPEKAGSAGDGERNANQTMASIDRNPAKVEPAAATTPSTGNRPPTPSTSAPSASGGSSAGNPASVVGQMMRSPMSASSSPPASSSPGAASTSGSGLSAAGAPGAQQMASTSAPGAGTGSGAGVSGAGRVIGAASAGAGGAEASARMGTGAISAASNAVGAAGNTAAQIAQSAVAAAPPPAPAVGPPPAAGGVPGGAPPPPVAMVPPGSVAAGLPHTPAAANVSPGVPGTAAQSAPSVASPAGAGVSGSSAGSAGPVAVPMSQVRAIGMEAATGDVLIGQAVDAARSIVESLAAQTRHVGYGTSQGFAWAVTVLAERSGAFTAWLASSDGPSYIPLGVRVPEDVRLAVTDPVAGRQLWEEAAAAGGANPLEVLIRHAELRDATAPGLRVLALASTLPLDRVKDWAALRGARAVSVDPRTIDPAPADNGGQHRCAAAMPWEWNQAHKFTEQQRLQIAARHMLMAATAGHLTDAACERVMDAFERRKPITESDWADVNQARAAAAVNYDLARMGVSMGGGATPPEWAFRTARAAEVVWCLREHGSAAGCADLLYAARLAGAPLNPAAAVA